MNIETIVLILFGLIILAFIINLVKKAFTKEPDINKIWSKFAKSKNLSKRKELGSADFALIGKNKGFPFRIEVLTSEGVPKKIGEHEVKRGQRTSKFTRVYINFPGIPKEIRLYREKLISKVGKIMGLQDIKTGDSEFDRAFIIKGKNENKVLSFLNSDRRKVLLSAVKEMPGIELTDHGLFLQLQGQVNSLKELENLYNKFGDIASKLAA